MNNLATQQAESPAQAENPPVYRHPELKASYLKELTTLWMRSDYMRTSKIIIAFTDQLKEKHGLEKVGNCMAYYLMIGSTPPIADLVQARLLRTACKVETKLDPFFDFEGEWSVLAFVEARVRKSLKGPFKAVHDEYLARVAAQEAASGEVESNSGTFAINL